MDTKQSAVFLDVENLIFAGIYDKGIVADLKDLTKQIADFIEKTAESYNPVGPKYAAISLMPKNGSHGVRKKREEVMTAIKTLVDKGFTVATVSQGEDAADKALYNFGISLKNDPTIETFVIASGDGRGPIMDLVKELEEAEKKTHVVAYDHKPVAIRNAETNSKITASLLAPHLHITSDIISDKATSIKTDPKTVYRKVIQFFNGEKRGSPPQKEHLETFRDSVAILSISMKQIRQKEVNFGFLIKVLMQDLLMAHPNVTEKEVRDIANLLTTSTDMFEKPTMYRLNNNSQFQEKVK